MKPFPSLKLRLALWAYAAAWHLLLPLILLYLWRRGRRDRGYVAHLAERFGRYRARMESAVWVHAVSLGEMRSAVPLIRAFLARGDRVVTTHFTPAGRREAERVFAPEIAAGQVASVWIPIETAWAFRRFFRAFRPAFGLVMEVEIWPRMIMAARGARVPLFLCNAQYPLRSFTRDTTRTGLRAEVMRGLAGAFVKSDLQASRFAAVGVPNIHVTGELRFDQPIPPAQLAAGEVARAAWGLEGRPVITIASAVEGEDATYVAALRALGVGAREDAPLIVYVPRRPERFDEVAATLRAAGFPVARRSEVLDEALRVTAPLAAPVLLGDSLGEMYFYLSLADRVVVGGGFTPAGAHNIIEPLAVGKPVVTGPVTWPIEYPFAEAEAAGVARSVPDAAALAVALGALPRRPSVLEPMANTMDAPRSISAKKSPEGFEISDFFAAHSGAAERTLAALPEALAAARATSR
jgi:3-deoxy-D-manno-octulosonic-acid transferase